MLLRSFADDAYGQDLIAPIRVEHRVEFGDRSGEAPVQFGHYYNYLFYVFAEDGGHAEAVHYLDEEARVSLRHLEPPDLLSGFAQRVLVFLTMRYRTVVVASEGREAPLPPEIADAVAARRERHFLTEPNGA